MPDFSTFRNELNNQIAKVLQAKNLYQTGVDRDEIWELYLDSFPAGTNEVYRTNREYDCSCCRSFIKNFAGVVSILDHKLVSVWDFIPSSDTFKPVVAALRDSVHAAEVTGLYVPGQRSFGQAVSREFVDGACKVWEHMFVSIPTKHMKTPSQASECSSTLHLLERAIVEITPDSMGIVLELVAQNSLYRGAEWKSQVETIQIVQQGYAAASDKKSFLLDKVEALSPATARIRNSAIGTLLIDLSEGMEIEPALARYEKVVAPANYKRPKPVFTAKMVEDAQMKIAELGYGDSLERRFAHMEDITVNNVLFANRDAAVALGGTVFDELKSSAKKKPQTFNKVVEIGIEDFIENVLPTASAVEAYLDSGLSQNFVSLIAPQNQHAKSMFKWENNFSWAYSGNLADSDTKERVRKAGGAVDGVLRFSLRWNDNNDNESDLDAHCLVAGAHIYYANHQPGAAGGGSLDVDNRMPGGKVAVENISWPKKATMPIGDYDFSVHNYCACQNWAGFSCEIEFDGVIHTFVHSSPLDNGKTANIATVTLSKGGQFSIKPHLESGQVAGREVWGVQTGDFCPVSVCMRSPNYWDERGQGSQHYFFMLSGCQNPDLPSGFFNEYLDPALSPHRKVFEALTNKMRVKPDTKQLSGLGFCATKRQSLVVRVTGNIQRVLKIVF